MRSKQATFEFIFQYSDLLRDRGLRDEISLGGERKALEIDEIAKDL